MKTTNKREGKENRKVPSIPFAKFDLLLRAFQVALHEDQFASHLHTTQIGVIIEHNNIQIGLGSVWDHSSGSS